MTLPSTFEDQLDDFLEDGPTDAPRQLLDTILAAVPSIPQRRGAWRIPWRTSPMTGFARLLGGIAIVVGLGSVALLVVTRPAPGGVGGQGSQPPAVVASATPTAPTASTASTPSPKPTAAPTTGPCDAAQLAARITLWEGAAGHRIADVELTNGSSGPCIVQAMAKPELVDGHGSVIIDGAEPATSGTLTVGAGEVLKTLVQDGNYCGPLPLAPVTVAFILGDGGRVVATPFSPTDVTVPPCLGAPGSAGDIEMQPWAP
jgi:Protein of unknown function (DUF4232)